MSTARKNNDTPGTNLQPDHHPDGDKQETTPAEERGERLDTGKTIARGGKDGGTVPGAEPSGGQ